MTDKMKSWFGNNWTMVISGLFLIGMNYGILTAAMNNKIDMETSRQIADKEITEKVVPTIEAHSKLLNQIFNKDFSDTKLQLEIKFNLKRLMEAQGLHYIENTDK